MAIPVYLLLQNIEAPLYLSVVVLLFIVGIKLCDITSKYLGVHDHSGIVIDAISGYLITLIVLQAEWILILAGFILFRVFDILKPWPISCIDKNIHGGFGIMFDDVVAGLLALSCLHLIMFFYV